MIVTMPGRFGDVIWALPACRALSLLHGPVDLVIGEEFASLLPLLELQPYLRSVRALAGWTISHWEGRVGDGEAPITPAEGEAVVHLGYRRWPELPLPYEIAQTAGVAIDLKTPWIETDLDSGADVDTIVVGFTEAWFELKLGLLTSLGILLPKILLTQLAVPGGRWTTESWATAWSWQEAAYEIQAASLFFGDCSALHVLACALGTPVVLMEPMEARWNPIFYPYGMDGPQVMIVRGNDSKPTFDARHCADALRLALAGVVQ